MFSAPLLVPTTRHKLIQQVNTSVFMLQCFQMLSVLVGKMMQAREQKQPSLSPLYKLQQDRAWSPAQTLLLHHPPLQCCRSTTPRCLCSCSTACSQSAKFPWQLNWENYPNKHVDNVWIIKMHLLVQAPPWFKFKIKQLVLYITSTVEFRQNHHFQNTFIL